MDWNGPHGLLVGTKKLYRPGTIASGNFFQVFPYPLYRGNPATVLKDPYSIVLTRTLAKSLFGKEDAVNETVRLDNEHNLKVTGILEDLPANTSFAFEYLIPFSFLEETSRGDRRFYPVRSTLYHHRVAHPADTLTNSNLTIPYGQPLFWVVLAGLLFFTSILAGSRPAIFLSSFSTIKTINAQRGSVLPRKILVVTQFTCSIALIVGTLIVYQQLPYARGRDTGYNVNRLPGTDLNIDLSRNYTR